MTTKQGLVASILYNREFQMDGGEDADGFYDTLQDSRKAVVCTLVTLIDRAPFR